MPGNWSAESGYRAGLKLASDADVTAIFAANDPMALGALRAFNEAGLRVPQDISVAGCDDHPEAAYFTPPLTTAGQDFRGLGARCVQRLFREIAQEDGGATSLVSPRLIVRSSTGPRNFAHARGKFKSR
jgi:DNA-binding LacI/PurR family transcriptional regulator